MLLLLPPAEIQSLPLPSHVYPDIKAAKKGAAQFHRQLICIFPEDQTRWKAAQGYLQTLEGAWLRSQAEIWLANPGQAEVQPILEKGKISSLPAIVQMNSDYSTVRDFIAGEDVAPFDKAFHTLLERLDSVLKPMANSITEWSGQDPRPFIAFGKAREKDLAAGAAEPHRTWLVGLFSNGTPELKLWASTRLIEANALLKTGEPEVFKFFLKSREKHFLDSVQNRNPKAAPIPWMSLGFSGYLDSKAPCWSALRSLMRGPNSPKVGTAIYALMAPALTAEDRDWVLRAFSSKEASKASDNPWNNTIFWLGADWLLAYGNPEDWKAFQSAEMDSSWREALYQIQNQVEQIPGYWNTSIRVQDLFCEGQTIDGFWKNPDACLASWGVTRENLIALGLEEVRLVKGGLPPRYPKEAQQKGFTGTLRIRTLVDQNGKVLWARPIPGYALCFFAPFGLKYATNSTFQPAQVAGIARPSQFIFTFPFKLR
jgi:hypothetical protein